MRKAEDVVADIVDCGNLETGETTLDADRANARIDALDAVLLALTESGASTVDDAREVIVALRAQASKALRSAKRRV